MKQTKNIVGTMLLMGAVIATSCVDDKLQAYQVEKPASIASMEYLNDYTTLKDYLGGSVNPDFKLGVALAANDYIDGGVVARLANANFAEMTAGNAMKYASCVAEDGTMDFGTVEKFVAAAKAGGMSIYGHTLAWHSQQNNKYLNGLIKDKEIEIDPSAANNFITYTSPTPGANPWDKQAHYSLPVALEKGAVYTFKVDIKATDNCKCGLWPIWAASPNKDQWGGSADVQYLEEKDVLTTWSTHVWTFTAAHTHDKMQFVFGKHGGKISFDNLVLVKEGTDNNLVNNGDFADESIAGWANNWQGPSFAIDKESAGPVAVSIPVFERDFFDGTPAIGWGNGSTREVVDGVLVINNPSATNHWDAQAAFDAPAPFENGKKYFLKLKIKGSQNGLIRTLLQKPVPPEYPSRGDFPMISVSTEWQEVTVSTTCSGDDGSRLVFSIGDYAGSLYIDDLTIYYEQSMSSIPLTPKQKKAALTTAMNNWIEGMMKATKGYVSTWDVVNEAIAGGGDNGEGFYPLQSASNASDAASNFYWQDYLGNEDYVRIAVAAARKYYAENEGKAPLKLFINDYNLESDWDDNKKLKSLLHWIGKWEADGVTKIDGIGTQMHVSYYANPATQKSKEDHVVKMLQLLANSGKLVKISELDMGYINESGQSVKTEDMTEAQHKAMAGYYKFIIKKFFEIIPKAQQYGITQWCITDSPSGSGWRGGEPVGLWNADYSRKHTYAGFADGLAGK